jgi:hypothetical protein
MKRIIITCLQLTALCFFAINCHRDYPAKFISDETEIDSVKAAIHHSIGWAKNKDFRLLYSIIANDSDYLEVDPDPGIIRGFSQFKKNEALWNSPDFKSVGYNIRDLTISLSKNRDVAWYYCVLDDINEWKGQSACWMNTRWTGVLEKRDGRWVIVQMHFSFAKV